MTVKGRFGQLRIEHVLLLACIFVLCLCLLGAGIVVYLRLQPREILETSAVPEQYRNELITAAKRCPAISAPLLAAQIEVESRWRPQLVAKNGNAGLAQFPPSIWATFGIDGDDDGSADVLNPVDSIASQAAYLCFLAEKVSAASATSGVPVVNLMIAAFRDGATKIVNQGGVLSDAAQQYVTAVLALVPKYTSLEEPAPRDVAAGWRDPLDGPYQRGVGFWVPGKLWKWKGHHTGVDFVAAEGTRVVAAGPGSISSVTPDNAAYGNFIVIQNGVIDGLRIETLYAHMVRFADVKPGQKVKTGDLIGFVGQTGNATGPHLHFEVHQNWKGGDDNAEFLDGFKWVDDHRGADAPRWGGPPVQTRPSPLDGDDGPPR